MPNTALYVEHSALGPLMRHIVGTDDSALAGIAQSPYGKTAFTTCRVHTLDGRQLLFVIGHDERRAPYVLAHDGSEDASVFVSFTDENGTRLLAYAHTAASEGLCGVGVDLCALSEFAVNASAERFSARFFSEAEQARVAYACDEERVGLYATIFSGKEAAFKSTSQALRRHYERGGEEVHFTVRDFEVEGSGWALPIGPASEACKKLGIVRIGLRQERLDGMIISVATARR